MRKYYDPETDSEVTVVNSIQVSRWNEFSESGIEHFEPKFSLEGGRFPKDKYAVSQNVARQVEDEMMVDLRTHGIEVVDTEDLERP